jgi:outer membrane protein assembly factor BamA
VIDFPYGDYDEKKRYDVRLQAGYNENTSPNDSVQAIVQTEELNLSALGRYYVSERTFLRGGVEFLDKQSQTAGFDDVQRISVPIEFFYDYSEDLSYGVGYRYTETDVSADVGAEADSTDHAVFLAVVGQVAPSVTAEVRLGGQERKFDDSTTFEDETGFFMESLLTWAASDLTTVELNVGNDFDTAINGVSKETLFAEVGVQHQFSDKIRASAGLGYEDVKYSNDRDDEHFSVAIGSVYTLIEDQLEIEGGLRYADRDSTKVASNYDVLTARISISYLF